MPQPITIVLAEDFAPLRKLVSAMLGKRPEFQVVAEVEDGLEAIEKAVELQPDIILLDIGLPGISGLKAAERIRALAPYTRPLFLSQESSPAIVRESFRVGGWGYIQKTSAYEDLIPAIETILGSRYFVSASLRINDVELPRHVTHLYRDEAGVVEGFTRFIGTAMKAGDATILLAIPDHLEAVAQSLKAQGLVIDGAIQRGGYVALDANLVLASIMRGSVPDCDRLAECVGSLAVSAANAMAKSNPRVAIASECAGLLCAADNIEGAMLIDDTAREFIRVNANVDILCTYGIQQSDSAFERVCAVYQHRHSADRPRMA